MLNELMTAHHDEIIVRARAKARARSGSDESAADVPLVLRQLGEALRLLASPLLLQTSAANYGQSLQRYGLPIAYAVHGFGDIGQVVTELALERGEVISTADFRALNRRLVEGIASAVTGYARQRDAARLGQAVADMTSLAHDLRNHLTPAMLALSTVKNGAGTFDGDTGTLLERCLLRLGSVIDRMVSEVRMTAPRRDLSSANSERRLAKVLATCVPERQRA